MTEEQVVPAQAAGDVQQDSQSNSSVIDDKSAPGVDEKMQPSLAYHKLFRYADWIDVLLMVTGSIGAMGLGCALPLFSIIFGDLLDLFGQKAPNSNQSHMAWDQLSANEKADAQEKMQDAFLDARNDLCLKFLYIAIGSFAASFLEMACWELASIRQTTRIRNAYLQNLLKQDIRYFDVDTTSGALLSGLDEHVSLIQQATGNRVGQVMQHASAFVAGMVIAFVRGWKLTLVMLSVVPIMALVGALIAKIIAYTSSKKTKSYSQANSIAYRNFGNIRTVAAFSGERRGAQEYSDALQYPTKVEERIGIYSGMFVGMANSMFYYTFALAMWYGSLLIRQGLEKSGQVAGETAYVQEGDYTGGRVMTVLFSAVFGSLGLGQAGQHFSHFFRGQQAGRTVFDILDAKPTIELDSPGGQMVGESFRGDVSIEGVDFAYPSVPDRLIFRGFTLTIPAGQTVALVGSSGCGKSTVTNLVQRFYDPQAGRVLIDGLDIREYNLRSLRDHMGLVSQEPALFAATIYENIAYGKQGASLEEVEDAAKAANAHRFIQQLPEAYHTWVGEAGVQLSGGQKQRIAIARAILKNPQILILDEATSALDSQSEKLVQAAIDRMISGSKRTTIVIAHRLSTIRGADKIAVVRAGQVVEEGRHAELAARPQGEYATLISLQQAAETVAAQQADEVDEDLELEKRVHSQQAMDSQRLSIDKHRSVKGIIFGPAHGHVASNKEVELQVGSDRAVAPEKPKASHGGKEAAAKTELKAPGFLRLIAYNKPELAYAFVGMIACGIAGASMPVFSFVFSEMIAAFFIVDPAEQRDEADQWTLVLVGMGTGLLIVVALQTFCFTIMGARLTYRIRQMLMRAIMRQEVGWFDDPQHSSGILASKLQSEAASIRGAVGDTLGVLAQNVVTFLTGFTIAFVYSWKLALAIVACIPVLVFSAFVQQKMQYGQAVSGTGDSDFSQASATAGEAIRSVKVVQSFNLQEPIQALYSKQCAGPLAVARRGSFAGGLGFGFSNFVMFTLYALAFWYGGKLVGDGDLELDSMLKVFFAIMFSAMGATEAHVHFPEVAKAGPASKEVFAIVDRQPLIDATSTDGVKSNQLQVEIMLDRVCFYYPSRPDVQVFKQFTLHVPAGTKVALVGESGSGKSTVVALLERFYDPQEGRVLLDGRDLREYHLPWLRQQLGLVAQEPVLFSMPLLDNIKYGCPGATMEEVQAAAQAANAAQFISELPQGYATLIGDKGVQLSGGQKQRIAIARAILSNPKVLLLDEATSALDAKSERVVQEALDTVMEGRTTVAIAHRLSTIRGFDSIAVVQRGVIVEQGPHEELMAKPNGNYAKLVRMQNARK